MNNTLRKLRVVAEKRWRLVVLASIAVLLLLAWANRFIQDDAFISFRYARNLANGAGLTWNAGERVEGYTNFLWVLLMAVPIKLGLDPVAAAYGMGLACFALTLALTYQLARLVLVSRWAALVTIWLLGLNHTFSAYATGGLETQLQACALVATAYLAVRARSAAGRGLIACLLGVSLCASVALLTRLDSAVALAPLYGVLLYGVLRSSAPTGNPVTAAARGDSVRAAVASLVALCGPALVLVGGWLLWKLSYYGGILPNTYYAKATSPSLTQGAAYVYRFVTFYWLAPVILLGLVRVKKFVLAGIVPGLLAVTAALWVAYIVAVGGDFMEFRFFVPILPFVLIVAVWLIHGLQEGHVRLALGATLAIAGVLAASGYKGYGGVESIAQLQGHLTNANENWIGAGRALGDLFDESEGVVIATTAAGAIPYYSTLETVDMLGLNDPWVARQGATAGSRAGHQKLAPYAYLLERKVNLVIGHPRVGLRGQGQTVYTAQDLEWFTLTPVDAALVPETAQVLEIPLDETYALTVLYLTPHPAVDAAIRDHALKTYPVAE